MLRSNLEHQRNAESIQTSADGAGLATSALTTADHNAIFFSATKARDYTIPWLNVLYIDDTSQATAAQTVRPPQELGAAWESAYNRVTSQGQHELGSLNADLSNAVLASYRLGGMQAVNNLMRAINQAIPIDGVGPLVMQNGGQLELHHARQIRGDELARVRAMSAEERARAGYFQPPESSSWYRDLEGNPPQTIDRPNAAAAARPIADAIVGTPNDNRTAAQRNQQIATLVQDALNQGIALDDLAEAINLALPESHRPPRGNALTIQQQRDRRVLTVHPRIGGFALDTRRNADNTAWSVTDSGVEIR